MARNPTPAQTEALDALRREPPGCRVDYFDFCMEGDTALVTRTLRTFNVGGVGKTQDQMYRVHPDGRKTAV